MKTYFISGHLDLTEEEFKEHYVPRILDVLSGPGCQVVVGDAAGADTMVQEYLHSLNMEHVVVFHMKKSPRNNAGGFPTISGYSSDEERDTALTAASDEDIAWVRPGREKSGTAKNLIRRSKSFLK